MIPKPVSCVGCPLYEAPHGKTTGFSFPSGVGDVLVVAEALGKEEEIIGEALVGKSGYTLFQDLKRVDIERESFTLFNVVACRPPDNKLVKMVYEKEAIAHCAPNLDKVISNVRDRCKANGKTFVIITLGVTAFKRVLELDSKKDAALFKAKHYYSYPFWSDTYQAWVFNAPHPAFLVRGKTYLWPVVRFVFKRALEVSTGGMRLAETKYLLDPPSVGFDDWVNGYEQELARTPDSPLSYDIETPYKKKVKDEEELSKEEGDLPDDHIILRIGFSYWNSLTNSTSTVSIKWSAEFMASIERLFSIATYVLGWNSDKYDFPRVNRQVKVEGIGLDGMVAWHILNTSLPKALGFVTPYYNQDVLMWKHLADDQPAFYNAKDAEMALLNFRGIKADLIKNRLWHVYERHWIELYKAIKYMTGKGVMRDNQMRQDAEVTMSTLLDEIEARMEAAIPDDARDIKVFKTMPKVARPIYELFPEPRSVEDREKLNAVLKESAEGLFEFVKDYPVEFCGSCGLEKPTKWKAHSSLCGGGAEVITIPQTVWGRYLDFKISKKRMTSYQASFAHQAIRDRKEHKVTFNADAIEVLCKKYPEDKLYPEILKHRKVSKLLSTYVGVTRYAEVEVPDDYVLQPGEEVVNAH